MVASNTSTASPRPCTAYSPQCLVMEWPGVFAPILETVDLSAFLTDNDFLVMVDPSLNGDGSDYGRIPDWIWNTIIQECKAHFTPKPNASHIIVILRDYKTNISDDQVQLA